MLKKAAAADAGRYGEAAQTYRWETANPRPDVAGEAFFQLSYLLEFYDSTRKD